jgi:hypothetical protein
MDECHQGSARHVLQGEFRGRERRVESRTAALADVGSTRQLLWMEKTLRSLRAPTWPADVLGPIDQEKAARGRALFGTHCANWHGIKELPDGTRHGDYVAKVRLAPVKAFADCVTRRALDLASADQVFRPALVAELRERPYQFDIEVQLCTDLTRMPVENVTVRWPETLSPFVTVAKLRLPQQDIGGEAFLDAILLEIRRSRARSCLSTVTRTSSRSTSH